MNAHAGSAPRAGSPNADAMSAVGSSPERAAVRGSPTAYSRHRETRPDLIAKGGKARTFESPRFPRSSRFNPVPVMPTNVDPRTIFSQEDMGERASFPFSIYNTVAGSNGMRASSYRYAPAFKSKVGKLGTRVRIDQNPEDLRAVAETAAFVAAAAARLPVAPL